MNKPLVGRWPYVGAAALVALRPAKERRVARQVAILASLIRFGFVAPGLHVTNMSKSDGGGSQIHQALSVQAFCEAFRVPYAHTPLVAVEHSTRPDDVVRWEQEFDLGRHSPRAADLGLPIVPVDLYVRSPGLWRQPCVLAKANLHPFLNATPQAYDLIRTRAIECYRGNREREIRPGAAELSVAVHVRRGDVTERTKRYTPDARIIATIEAVQAAADTLGLATAVTVFSQGDRADFSSFTDRGWTVSLDGDPLEALSAMVNADVLITAKSSFSFVAGLLNTGGLVVCDTFRFTPLSGWYTIDNQQEASAQDIKVALARHRAASAQGQGMAPSTLVE